MLLFFAWEQTPVVFDPDSHARMDLDIFDLTLVHEEGQYARARLTIHPHAPLPSSPWGILSMRLSSGEMICLFQGARCDSPRTIADNLVEIELIACPPDADKQLRALLTTHKESAFFEPLLVSEPHATDPHVIRLSRPVHFYWDPRSLKVSLSSLFAGKSVVDVTPLLIADTLKFQLGEIPLSQVTITLQAQWVQRATGFMNLSSSLAKLFPEKIINTFTGNPFKAFWPRTGQHLGRSGYWVAYSKLIEIPPPPGEADRSHPVMRSTIKGVMKALTARRRWFKAKLIVGWQFQQKRIERITFTLCHAFQRSVPCLNTDSTPHIFLTLQPICPDSLLALWSPHTLYDAGAKIQEDGERYHCIAPHRSSSAFSKDSSYWQSHGPLPGALPNPAAASFFLTIRGQKVLEAGLDIAQTLLATRSRGFEFSFAIPFETHLLLSPQDQVSLSDSRFPGGHATGKIVSTTVKICGQTGERLMNVKAKASFGADAPLLPVSSTSDPFLKSSSGIAYRDYSTQSPQDPYAQLALLRYTPLIKKLALLNGPDVQESALRAGESSFQNKQTRILLKLKKLYTQESLTHGITVELPKAWSSPQQINLKETPHVQGSHPRPLSPRTGL